MSGYGYLIQKGYFKKITAKGLAKLKGIVNQCINCKSDKNLTIDHKLPKSTNRKARGFLSNYQLLCKSCNELKGNKK